MHLQISSSSHKHAYAHMCECAYTLSLSHTHKHICMHTDIQRQPPTHAHTHLGQSTFNIYTENYKIEICTQRFPYFEYFWEEKSMAQSVLIPDWNGVYFTKNRELYTNIPKQHDCEWIIVNAFFSFFSFAKLLMSEEGTNPENCFSSYVDWGHFAPPPPPK